MAYSDVITATANLISYWRLGEASTGSAAADSFNANPGTYTGGVTAGVTGALAGDSNTAVTLNGTTGYVAVTHSASLNTGNTVSIEFWINRNALATTQACVVKGTTSWFVYLNSSNEFVLAIDSLGTISWSTALADLTNWHHVVVTKNAATSFKIYIDGADATVPNVDRTFVDNSSPVRIGASPAGTPGSFLNASIDEVAVYGRALTAGEVAAHYAAGISPPADMTSKPGLPGMFDPKLVPKGWF